jgi:hypothetical protein
MTRSHPSYAPERADRILQERARGRTMTDILAEPGMPSANTVRLWVKDDIEGFAARYAKADETGAPLVRHPSKFTAEITGRIATGIVGGRPLEEICREPGMPDVRTVYNWVAENREDFAARYREAQEIGRAMNGGRIPYSRELADRVIGELMEGRTLVDICKDPGMPSKKTVLLWVRRDKDGFAARYREAREIGGHIMVDEMIEIADNRAGDLVRVRKENGETELVVDHENIRRSELRCETRRWILARALPRLYGNRLQIEAKHDAGNGWAELLKELNGKTRGVLPSEDEPSDGQ